MLSLKTDLKKIYYTGIAVLIFLIILSYFIFFLSLQNHLIQSYLPDSKNDAVLVSKSNVYKDLLGGLTTFFIMSLVIFSATFVFSIVTYTLYIKKPFQKLRQGFRTVKDGDFETRIPVKGLNEIASLFEEFNNMVKSCQKKISIKHYVSSSTKKMVEILNTGEITTQPRRKLLTVFFSDIRGFTSFAEEHDPMMVITTVNEIFDIQVALIKKYSGDIDKFIGDEIMAEFPTPSAAFKCATEIQAKLSAFNKKRSVPLNVGIGINFGEAIVGAIGSGDQFNWTMVGHTVNIGRHLCSVAEPGQIVVSQEVQEKLKVKRQCKRTDVKMKKLAKPVKAIVY